MWNPSSTYQKDPDGLRLKSCLDYESFLERLATKDRVKVEKHMAACDAEADPRHAALWRRIACKLMDLARHSLKLNGQRSTQFYAADGQYRIQVFAMEDAGSGMLSIYCKDVLEEAIRSGLLVSRAEDAMDASDASAYPIAGTDEHMFITRLDSKTPSPAVFVKDMLGWNRKALHMVLPVTATDIQIQTLEAICAASRQCHAAQSGK